MTKRKCPNCKKERWSKTPSWEFPPICLVCRRKAGEPKRAPKKPGVWGTKKSLVQEMQPKNKKSKGKKKEK